MTRSHIFTSVIVLSIGLFVSGAIVLHAQVSDEPTDQEIREAGITFPIPELGNCANKRECKAYCDGPENISQCVAFAEAHGLMNREEARRAREFSGRLIRGDGPGGCRNPRECHEFCNNVNNLEVCVAFAEEHGVQDEHIEDGKRILRHLRGGGTLPGGCTSKESCEVYCSDFTHIKECLAFAREAGIRVDDVVSARGEGSRPSPVQLERLAELIEEGATPGGCSSKNECEAYCRGGVHFEECVNFGVRVGFIDAEKAERARQAGGRGPGECNSERECRAYCENSEHHEECFQFAEEHGILPPEGVKRIKEGTARLRAGLDQAPPEVRACLKSVLGPIIIEDIQAGRLVPGPQIGERMRTCFEKHGDRPDPSGILNNAPPEVTVCLRNKLGGTLDRVRAGEVDFGPEIGDTFRACSESVKFEREGPSGGHRFGEFLRTAPPGVAQCVKRELGSQFDRLARGDQAPSPEIEARVKKCFEEFVPRVRDAGQSGGGFAPGQPPTTKRDGTPPVDFLSPRVVACIVERGGTDALNRIKRGEDVSPEVREKLNVCFSNTTRPIPFPIPRNQAPSDGSSGGFVGSVPPVSSTPGLPSEVALCIRNAVGADAFERLQKGERPTAAVAEHIRVCTERFKSSVTPSPLRLLPTDSVNSGVICAQVITPAHNPATGECKRFPTPCDVPSNWVHGCPASTDAVNTAE